MTQEHIHLVQTSFATLALKAHTVAVLFYARLFELDPTLQPLFRGDMLAQGAKLMQTLALAVDSLHRLEPLLPTLRALGQRHVSYGVKAADYATVGTALLWTLEQVLGPAYTPATGTAWAQTYHTLATVMQDAAASAATPAT